MKPGGGLARGGGLRVAPLRECRERFALGALRAVLAIDLDLCEIYAHPNVVLQLGQKATRRLGGGRCQLVGCARECAREARVDARVRPAHIHDGHCLRRACCATAVGRRPGLLRGGLGP